MSIQDEIIKTIALMVEKSISSKINLDIATTVIGINGDKYQVIINGENYWVYDAVGCSPIVGSAVWLHLPNSNSSYTNAYISGLRNASAK